MNQPDVPNVKTLNQQINRIGEQMRDLEKLESEAAAAREHMTVEQKKLANQVANKRVLLGMDRELRTKMRDKLKEQVPKNQRDAQNQAIRKIQEEMKALQAKWPKLYGDRDVPDPCVPCLKSTLTGVKENWEAAYPPLSRNARKIAEEICQSLGEAVDKTDGPLKKHLEKARSIGVLENLDGSYTAAFSGQPGDEAVEVMKVMEKRFAGRNIKFVEFNPAAYDTQKKPYLTPTRKRDEVTPPEGSDAHPSEGRYCCERKIFGFARQNDIPVSGMYIQYCGGAKSRKNPFPVDGADDPNQMSPCPSCKINHAKITRNVRIH
jgi:uncharacterized protein (UPF0147 family)